MSNNPKTFLAALNLIHSDPRKAKSYMEDKRLTLQEKKILNCWFLIKSCKHNEILKTLNSININENELIEGQRLLIIGITYNNQGLSKEATENIGKAFDILEKYSLPIQHFIAAYNLFIANLNNCNTQNMKNCLQIMKHILTNKPNAPQELCHLQCQFCYYVFTEQIEEAELLSRVLDQKHDLMSDAMMMTHLLTRFKLQIKKEDMIAAEKVLKEIKKFRLFRFSSTFMYIRTALDHLVHGRPLYAYRRSFKDCDSLFYQLKVIQSLEEADLANAKRYWKELMSLNADLYLDGFNYRGDKDLFSLCLLRHSKIFDEKKSESDEILNIDKTMAKSDLLILLLENAAVPVRKDAIFKALWETDIESENDEAKIRNLISYVRKKKNINISFRRGCYFIDASKKKSA